MNKPIKSSQKTKSYRVWNWKSIALMAIPMAIIQGFRLAEDLSQLGPFILSLGLAFFGIYSMMKEPWITKMVYEIYNYKQNEDGSETVEYAESDVEGSTKMTVLRSKSI